MRSHLCFLTFFHAPIDRLSGGRARAWPWRSVPFEAFTFYCDYVFPPKSRWCMVSDLRLRQVAAKKFMAAAFCRGVLARHQRHQSFIPPEYRHYHYPLCSLALLREVERGMAGRRKEGRREGLGWLLPSFLQLRSERRIIRG